MGTKLLKQKDGQTWRPYWYGAFDVDGKRKIINTGVKWTGTPPASGSLRDPGDIAFERSRAKAEAIVEAQRDESKSKGNATHLVERLIEAKTGTALEYTRIDELADKWSKLPREGDVGTGHIEQCRVVFASFADFMQERNPDAVHLYQVTAEDAAAWLAKIQAKYARNTRRVYYTLLRGAFGRFLPVGYNNPFPKLATHRGKAINETVHRKPFTPDELQKLLETARNDAFMFPLVTCAVCTGLRRGDVCSLRWDAVDMEKNALTVKTSKTGETVSIPIFEPLRAVLESIPKGRSPYVFPEAQKMHEENPTGLTYRFKRLIVEALTERPKAIPVGSVAMTETDEKAIREHEHDATRRARVLECYRLNLSGYGYKRIAAKTGLPLGTVAEYIRRAVAVTGKKAPRQQAESPQDAIETLTRRKREKGTRDASVLDWHALRTTWVTLALMAGVEMEVVRSVTGHATVEVVLRHYFKPQQEQYHAALARGMPAIITGKGTSQKTKSKALPPGEELAEIAAKVTAGTATEKDKKRLRVLAAKV
jgi:integrase